ncbi:MAG: hypothetical protein JHC74_11905 [Thermoleophilia bacterium]|nr:hypothetical protein [Thermoleophilia bacterium]
MTDTARQESLIDDALTALEVRLPAHHSWMGVAAGLPGEVVRLSDRTGVRRALVACIAERLYDSFYTPGSARASAPGDGGRGAGRLSGELAAANTSTGCREPGWRVVADEGDLRVVRRGALRLWVAADETPPGTGIGDVVAIRLPSDLPAYSPGFYTARGDRGFATEGPAVLDRLYFDLLPEGAVPFVREATRRLNRTGLAFVAKVVDDPAGFDRRDAAVLAVERSERPRALAAAEELRSALEPFLEDGAPAMTLPLAPGLAFAEDPGDGASFGAHRCHLLADAAVTAAERGVQDRGARLDIARERFAEAGVTLETPYLGPSSGRDGEAAEPPRAAVPA